MANKNITLMTEGSIAKQLIFFSMPLLIGNMCQQLYQVVDMLVVGNFIHDGGAALAAVGSGTPFINMMIGFFQGIATGAGVVVSRYFGAQDQEGMEKSIRISVSIAAVTGILISIVSMFICDLLLSWTNTPDDVFALAGIYLKIYYAGFLPLLLYNMGAGILQALGNSKTPFYYLLVSCGLNIVLDVIFVAFMGMNVEGVGYATVLSQLISCALVLKDINGLSPLKKKQAYGDGERLAITRRILTLGLPMSFQSVTISFSNVLIQSFVNVLGTTTVAGWGVFNKLDGFILLPTNSCGIAITTFTSQNIGARKHERVSQGLRIGMALSCGTTVVLSGVLFLYAAPIAGMFTKEGAVIAATASMIHNMVPLYFLITAIRIYSGVLSGVGHSFWSMVIMVLNMCGLRVLLLYLLDGRFSQGINTVYYAYWASWAACLLCFMVMYKVIMKRPGEEIREGGGPRE